MTDCAILNQWIKESVPEVHKHLSSLGFEMIITNVLYKWFMSLFIQGMNKKVWIPIWDLLFIDGYKVFLRAAILLFMYTKNIILQKKSIMEINEFFEVEIEHFVPENFAHLLIKKSLDKDICIQQITQTRNENMPKIKENILKSKQSKKQTNNSNNDYNCNLDWPFCVAKDDKDIDDMMLVFKRKGKIIVRKDFFSANKDVRLNIKKKEENNKDNKNENQIKYDKYKELLIVRQVHNCGIKCNLKDSTGSFDNNTPTQNFNLFNENISYDVNDIITNVEITNSTINILEAAPDIDNDNDNTPEVRPVPSRTSLSHFLRQSAQKR